jgi:hypothetical protein
MRFFSLSANKLEKEDTVTLVRIDPKNAILKNIKGVVGSPKKCR